LSPVSRRTWTLDAGCFPACFAAAEALRAAAGDRMGTLKDYDAALEAPFGAGLRASILSARETARRRL